MQPRTHSPAHRLLAPLAARLRHALALVLGTMLLVLPACGVMQVGAGKSLADIRSQVPALRGQPTQGTNEQGVHFYKFITDELQVTVFAKSEDAPIREVRVIVKRGSVRTSAMGLGTVIVLLRELGTQGTEDASAGQWIVDNQQMIGALKTFGDVHVAIEACNEAGVVISMT